MAHLEEQIKEESPNVAINCIVKRTSEGFHNLPKEILVRIFSYCTEKEIASSLCRVCVNWWVASRHSSLWKTLEFQGEHLQISSICRKLHSAPYLQAVSFINVPKVVSAIRQICRCNKELKQITIRFTSSMEEYIPEISLRNLIKCCPQIELLDLKGVQYHSQWLYHELQKLKHLHHLNLGLNKHLRLQDLLVVVYNCRTLTELSLFQWGSREASLGITEQDAVLIFDLLHKQLISLKFDMQDLGLPVFKAILECRKLERLALNNMLFHVPDEVCISLDIHFPFIEKLTFREARYVSTDNFYILLSTPGFRLTKFDASGCWHIDDTCLEALASTCYETLQRLSVKRCILITEDGIGFILQNFPHLTHLNIAHIGELSLQLLDKIPKHLPNLKILIMDQTAEQQHGLLHHISSRLPRLKILLSASEFFKDELPYGSLH